MVPQLVRTVGQHVQYGEFLDVTMHWDEEEDMYIRARYTQSGRSRDCFVSEVFG